MTPLNTLQEVNDYKERIIRQAYVLQLSTFFTNDEKIEILACYKYLETICNDAIARNTNVIDSQTL